MSPARPALVNRVSNADRVTLFIALESSSVNVELARVCTIICLLLVWWFKISHFTEDYQSKNNEKQDPGSANP